MDFIHLLDESFHEESSLRIFIENLHRILLERPVIRSSIRRRRIIMRIDALNSRLFRREDVIESRVSKRRLLSVSRIFHHFFGKRLILTLLIARKLIAWPPTAAGYAAWQCARACDLLWAESVLECELDERIMNAKWVSNWTLSIQRVFKFEFERSS